MFYYCLFKQTVCFMFSAAKFPPRENKQEPESLKGKKSSICASKTVSKVS